MILSYGVEMRLYHCDAVSENKLLDDLEVTSDEIRVEVDRLVISSKRVTLSTITWSPRM